jgi:type III pantothenate kinase
VLLVIDVGNSTITLGYADGGELREHRRVATDPAATPEALAALLPPGVPLQGIVLASTVPPVAAAFETLATSRGIPVLVATAATIPIPTRLDHPERVGPDRLVNAFAVARLHGTPAVVIDCGTATTLDAVDHDGAFVGGAIAPGIELGLDALAARTARLPRTEIRLPAHTIGRDTAEAIASGTVLGHRLMIEGLLAQMRVELAAAAGIAPNDVTAVLTGGLSNLPWAASVEGIDAIDPLLTLRGLVAFHRAVSGNGAANGATKGAANGATKGAANGAGSSAADGTGNGG